MGISRLISNTANFTTLVHFSFHLRKNSKDSWQVDLRKAAKNSTVIESILCKPISTTTTYFSLFFSFFFYLSSILSFSLFVFLPSTLLSSPFSLAPLLFALAFSVCVACPTEFSIWRRWKVLSTRRAIDPCVNIGRERGSGKKRGTRRG